MIMKKGIAKIVSVLTLAAAMTVASAGGDIVSRAETVILPTDASGTQVEKNDSCIIDYSDTASGYINVKYIVCVNNRCYTSCSILCKENISPPRGYYAYSSS